MNVQSVRILSCCHLDNLDVKKSFHFILFSKRKKNKGVLQLVSIFIHQ